MDGLPIGGSSTGLLRPVDQGSDPNAGPVASSSEQPLSPLNIKIKTKGDALIAQLLSPKVS